MCFKVAIIPVRDHEDNMKQKLYIDCQSKRILAESAYKIVPTSAEVLDEAVLITENCIHKSSDNIHCKFCSGICASIKSEIFNVQTGEFEIKTTILRDKTVISKGDIKEVKKASKFIDKMSRIFSLDSKEYSAQEAKVTMPWYAGDRPDSWATDCRKCKDKASKSGELTICEQAKEYYSDNSNPLLPTTSPKFICTYQKQKILLVY